MTTIVKISGHELNDDAYLNAFARVIAGYQPPVVVVHGGGRELTTYQERLGLEARFVNGLRVTDAESLALAEMVLCGLVNKRLVRVLNNHGVRALGCSGVDLNIVQARPYPAEIDMLYTGEVAAVNAQPLREWLAAGITPVIAPVCGGVQHNFNVNADHVAGALAQALSARQVIFLSNVEGVLDGERRRYARLTAADAQRLVAEGVINGGMIPKVNTALEAVNSGVAAAVITNLAGLETHGGTTFVAEEEQQ
jgi:acetylglutamate kinase